MKEGANVGHGHAGSSRSKRKTSNLTEDSPQSNCKSHDRRDLCFHGPGPTHHIPQLHVGDHKPHGIVDGMKNLAMTKGLLYIRVINIYS